ncbi:GNAT family N-acetyltransferase [Methylobacterium nonmethylotrophicum]|uniref:N-acetyltransferase n=1 Tax=Methylobacterium nonmethylotrophicum TaxID=1141884 RepID=A0A4Z0NKC6_9HYPH|nr:GNAT family N-acetyltransferase [Methylobacterium nonmethylotrophicum]TGD96321.1 N-acetyltransferase [Methylobacterium nonmethylotrophicum]
MPIRPRTITTERLALRPTQPADAARAIAIRTDWDVARMLSRASFPPDPRETERWFADHQREWQAGEAYRFAVEHDGTMIGVVDLDGIVRGEAHLGYWFDRAVWGRGYATEAGAALVRFAFGRTGVTVLRAGHARDNPASGRVLMKLGFVLCGSAPVFSRPRGETITQCGYLLRHGSADVTAPDTDRHSSVQVPSFGRLLLSAPLEAADLPQRDGGLRDVEF